MPTVDERARAMIDAEWQKRTARFRGGATPLAAYLRKDRPESYLYDAALAALATAISQLDEARALLREASEAGQATLVAMDKYNEANGTFIIGPSLLRLAKSVAKITATLSSRALGNLTATSEGEG